MATLTANRKVILIKIGQGKIIRAFAGFGNRMRPRAHLVDRPTRVAGQLRQVGGFGSSEEFRYSDFKALLQMKLLKELFWDQPHTFYELSKAGMAALLEMIPATIVRGFPMHCDLCQRLTMDEDEHGNPVYYCDVKHGRITERRIAECGAEGDYVRRTGG